MRRLLREVSLLACVVLTTCTVTASNKAWIAENAQKPCTTERKGRQEDPEQPCKQQTSSVSDSNSKINQIRHKSSEDGSRKHIIVKKPGQLKVQHKVKDIKEKRIRKITGAFQRRDYRVGSPQSGKLKHPRVKHEDDRGTSTVLHLLRFKALEAIENLKRKIHNGKLPDLLSLNHTVEKQENSTPTAEDNLQASRNKLFTDVRKLIHRMILKNKKAQANPMGKKKQAKQKVEEYGTRQHSRAGPTRKKYGDSDEKISPSNDFEDRNDRRKMRARDKWGTVPQKWANSLDLQQFFHQMNGLPMENRKNDRLFIAQGGNNPVDHSGLGGVMMSPPASAAGLTSPSAGAEEFTPGAPKQMFQQQQNQIEAMANYFKTQAQSRAGIQPAVLAQPQTIDNPAMQGAAIGTGLSSFLQLNDPLASLQPFLSRFYTPSLPFGATDGRFPKRGYFGRGPYSDLDGQGPEATRYNSASIRDRDDDGVGSPIMPADAYPEDYMDAEAPDDDDDDGDDEEDDDVIPYRTRHEKSNIVLPLSESKSATRNPH